MYAFYIENFINKSTFDSECHLDFHRLGINDLKEIFQDI